MIALSMQIKAIIFSLIYGVFISFMVNVNYKCLFNKNMIFKIIFDSWMLYFFILQFINFGYLHVYFFLALSVGFFASFSFFKKLIRKNNVKK